MPAPGLPRDYVRITEARKGASRGGKPDGFPQGGLIGLPPRGLTAPLPHLARDIVPLSGFPKENPDSEFISLYHTHMSKRIISASYDKCVREPTALAVG